MSIIPYSSIFIDLTFKEYFKLFTKFVKPNDRDKSQQMLEDSFLKDKKKEKLIASLSVRSAFDLFFLAAQLPKDSEIIMTGINIPDMVEVVKCHGYLPVPLNVDPDKLAPKIEDIEKCINPKTKAIMVSYIFGASFFIDKIVELAKKHNLYLIEDLAETFMGQDYNGHPEAQLSLFSFGSIKYNTALNGAIAVVRDDVLYRKMKYIQDQYPYQPVGTYLKKCLKVTIPALLLNNTYANKPAKQIANAFNIDYKEYCVSLLRGFSKEGEFLEKFRFQPCTPLLANLAARMQTFNQKEFQEYIKNIKVGQDMLLEAGIPVPGHKADIRSFWLFPIVVSDVQTCYKRLNERGVDAYLGATQLKIVESPKGSQYESPEATREFFDRILYLPIHKRVPKSEIIRICKETIKVINEVDKESKLTKSKSNPKPKL